MTVKDLMVALGYEVDESSRKKTISDANALKSTLSKLLGTIGITISIAGLIKFGKDSVEAASDVEQMEQKFDVVFDNLSDSADEWAGNLADAIGRSKNSIKTYLADAQNLFVGFGMERDAAMEMSEQLTESAIDIASFSNLDDDTAINAMTKAVMGNSESAKTLGAVLNDTTRATAMAELGYSGTYDSLDQLSKMQVNYTAIMQQSQDAIGDAARSMDSFESKNRQLQAQLKDIKENVGKFILPYATKGLELLTKLTKKVQEFTAKLGDANTEGTIANTVWKKFNSFCEKTKAVIDKVVTVGKNLVNMLGGTENVLKLIGIVIAAIIAYQAAGKVLKVVDSLKSVKSILGGINLKMLAIIAVIVLVALLVEDFIGFMQGKDSLFGTLLENAGVDVDATREKFFALWDDLKQIFSYIADFCGKVFDGLKEFWDEHGDEIMAYASNLFNGIIQGISYMVAAIQPFLQFVINLVKAFFALINGDTDGAVAALQSALEGFQGWISNMLNALLAFLDGIFGGLPSKALEWGKDMLQSFINGITEKITALKEKITGIGDAIKEKLHFSKPDNGPLADSDQWMPDMMENFSNGIESGKEKIKSAITGVASVIKGVISGDSGSDASALADSASASGSTVASAIGGTTYNYNITQNNSFSNTFNGGDSTGTASKQLTQDAHDSTVYLAHAMALGR